MYKQLILSLGVILFPFSLFSQEIGLRIEDDAETAFISSWWFFSLLLMVIALTFLILFDKSTFSPLRLSKKKREVKPMVMGELRAYYLYLGFIIPAAAIVIHFFKLRAVSELVPNLIVGSILILLFFLSAKNKFIRKYLYQILLSFFILFSLFTLYKTAFRPFELITFGEWFFSLFFAIYVFQNMRHYWIFVGIQVSVLIGLYINPSISQQTAVLYSVFGTMILILNHVKHLVQGQSKEKLLFTNTIVNHGKSLVISSDKDGRINFISENVKEILGYEPEELLGNGWWEKTIDNKTRHENEREKIIKLYLNEEVTTRLIKTSRGDYKWIQWHDKRFNDNLIVGIGQDITELKLLEEQRLKRQEKFELQQSVINELNQLQFSQKKNLNEHIKRIIRKCCEGIYADRISLWEYTRGRLDCQHLFLKDENVFESGDVLLEQDAPAYFKTLLEGKTIAAVNVHEQAETQEFKDGYLKTHNIKSVVNLPIFVAGNIKFVFCIETITDFIDWDTDDLGYIKSTADLISISIENQKRIEAEERVKESEEIYRQINETIDSVFWLCDLQEQRIIYISPSCKDIFGVDQNYFLSNNNYWQKYVLEEDKKIILSAHQEIFTTGQYEVEYRIKKGGNIRWIKERSFAIRNELGEITKSSGMCSDITEENKLKLELKQLSLVAEKTSNGVLITDTNSRVLWANQGFLDMLEVPFEELIGKRPRDLFLSDGPQMEEKKAIFDDFNFNVEIEINTFKNNKKWVSIHNTSLTDKRGKIIQQIELVTDITERVKNTQKIEIQSHKLEQYAKELEFQNTLKEMLMQTQTLQDITLNALALIFVQLDHAHHIAMMFPDANELVLSGYFLEQEQLEKEEFLVEQISCYETCKQGEIYIQEDLLKLEVRSESDERNIEQGVRSYMVMPLIYRNNFLGILATGFSNTFDLSEAQINRLKEACQIISISIHQINLQQKLQAKTDDLLDSISYAKYIQESVLPDLKIFSPQVVNVALLYRPKDLVSGDFYWCKQTDRYSFVGVGDCTGHGVPGAFLTLIGINLLDQLIGIEKLTNPAQILKKMDRRMFNMLHRNSSEGTINDGMEFALCVYDKETRKMTFSGAGLGILYFKDEEERHIRGQRVSIADARDKEFPFENTEIDISGDEYFFMATDGYQDQLGGERYKRFSKNRLIALLKETKKLPANEQEQIWESTIDDYLGTNNQIDDYTVLGFQFKNLTP